MCLDKEKKAYNEMVEKVRHQMDEITFSMSKDLIDLSLRLVLHNIALRYENEHEYLDAIDRIKGNVINFIGLVVLQLHTFGEGINSGPFMELFHELLKKKNEVI